MLGMGDQITIAGLRRKRGHLAGEIEAAERMIVRQRALLANLDAVLLLFDTTGDPSLIPSVRPVKRGTVFRHGEMIRLALTTLRTTGRALSVKDVTECVAAGRGLDPKDCPLRLILERQVRDALMRMTRKGVLFRFEGKPVMFGVQPVRGDG
jgi:hypothetical protein